MKALLILPLLLFQISSSKGFVFYQSRWIGKTILSLSQTEVLCNDLNDSNAGNVTILERGPNHIVAAKPPSVVCHHSGWTGSRSRSKRGEEPEIPMLQRVRDAIQYIDSQKAAGNDSGDQTPKRKVNLIHRLDRGASGALLFAFADNDDEKQKDRKGSTQSLIEAMASSESTKTYVALVRGEGILHDVDFKKMDWFKVTREIKDENGEKKNATTWFNFVAGQPEISENGLDQPRMSLVLARPISGRWHQIRKHLNGISHPILGDTTHGATKVNREWKEKRNMPGERVCLHLARLQLPPTTAVPEGIDVSCPIQNDMMDMLRVYAPNVLEQSIDTFRREGILIESNEKYEVGKYTIPEVPPQSKSTDVEDVQILAQGDHFIIVNKPPTVVSHHSAWTGKRSDPNRRWREPLPMLQRVRDASGRRVNLVHRLDRGASGCLLFSFANRTNDGEGEVAPCQVTKTLIDAMQSPDSTKTYFALCDGNGIWNGVDYDQGWFTIDKPVKDEYGRLMENSLTQLRFISACILPPTKENSDDYDHDNLEGRKACIILARPQTGRWHQVRQHLSSIGHPIIGDSTHGRSRTNRTWKKNRKLQKQRTCLHLARLQIPKTEISPEIDVSCPLSSDLIDMLEEMPELIQNAKALLEDENINII